MHQLVEHAIEPQPHDERAFPRLDMDVARARLDGVEEEVIDQDGDLDVLLGGYGLQISGCLIHSGPRTLIQLAWDEN